MSRDETSSGPHRLDATATLILLLVVGFVVAMLTLSSRPDPDSVPKASASSTSADIPVGVTFGNSLQRLSEDDLARTLDLLVRMHATWIRVDMAWPDLQPDGPDQWNWSPLDRVVRAARDRGLQVLGTLTYTPAWARGPGCTTFACPPASDSAFAAYAEQVVDRYTEVGVRTYEIWNEPNLPLFWSGPNPVAYRNLLYRTVSTIKDAHPSTRVLFGGLAARPTAGQTIGPQDFLGAACVTGLCSGVDAVSYHPYTFPRLASDTSEPLNTWQAMSRSEPGQPSLQSVMRSVGLGSRKIWVTEFGSPTGTGPGGVNIDSGRRRVAVSFAEQAAILVDGLTSALDESDLVGAYMVHTWQDQTTSGNLEDHFGLRTVSGGAKPGYTALRRALTP